MRSGSFLDERGVDGGAGPAKKMISKNLILGSKLKRESIKQRIDLLLFYLKTTSEDEIYLSQFETSQ